MNCKEFQTLASDLAGGKVIEASQYKLALAHKNSCAPCAARLVNERALTQALQVTANAETGQASAHTKAALLKAFAEHTPSSHAPRPITTGDDLNLHRTSAPVTAQPNKVLQFQSAKPKPTGVSRWLWIAAAAAIVVLLTVGALSLLPLQSNEPKQDARAPVQNPVEQPTKENEQKAIAPAPENQPQKQDQIAGGSNSPQPENKIAPRRDRVVAGTTKRSVKAPSSNEVTTDYIPLTYVSDATAMESGHVVRMMVSRSTLIAMGLPMNVERDREMVKADVVVGDDGLARAIRFVYSRTQNSDD
ncbi:MAG: hypothetical protein AB1757_17450 [Acidobacteriota bacterium]